MAARNNAMTFNILTKPGGAEWIAHCLELDIVATGVSAQAAMDEIFDLIVAQVDYAFSNNNLEHLYHPAPSEVWEEFYRCRDEDERALKVESTFGNHLASFIPPWIIAKTCKLDNGFSA